MKTPAISESEWKVMQLLWKKAPQPAYDLIEQLSKTEEWHPNTIKTLLSRLQKKKAVGVTRYKNLFLYKPLVAQEECVRAETNTFLQRVFGGSIKPLLVHFVENENLSDAEIEELRRILQKKGKK